MTVSITNAKLRSRLAWVVPVLMVWGIVGLPLTMYTLLAGLIVHGIGVVSPFIYLGGVLGLGLGYPRWLRSRGGALRADETGLFLDGKRVIERKALTHGHVIREGERIWLRLVPRGVNASPIDVEVTGEAQANELLAALRLDRTVAEYRLVDRHFKANVKRQFLIAGTGIGGSLLSLGIMLLIARHGHSVGRSAMASLFFFWFLAMGLVGPIIVGVTHDVLVAVGLDGVWIRQRLVRKRFISFSQIRDVSRNGRDLTLTLNDGATVELHHSKENEKEAENLVARIRAGIEAFAAAPKHAGSLIARNGQTIEEWIAKSRAKNEQSANYRAAVVPEEELWRVVEDPAAAPTERAGAALALRQGLDDEGKIRLRIAAGACAEKQLRIALESAATADDDALIEALEPLDDVKRMALGRS